MNLLDFFNAYILVIAGLAGLVIVTMLIQAIVNGFEDRHSANTAQQYRIARLQHLNRSKWET